MADAFVVALDAKGTEPGLPLGGADPGADPFYGAPVYLIVLDRCHIPALAFALGMFIPLELNVPLVVGGAINWFVTTRSKDAEVNNARGEKGTLIASGFIEWSKC